MAISLTNSDMRTANKDILFNYTFYKKINKCHLFIVFYRGRKHELLTKRMVSSSSGIHVNTLWGSSVDRGIRLKNSHMCKIVKAREGSTFDTAETACIGGVLGWKVW